MLDGADVLEVIGGSEPKIVSPLPERRSDIKFFYKIYVILASSWNVYSGRIEQKREVNKFI